MRVGTLVIWGVIVGVLLCGMGMGHAADAIDGIVRIEKRPPEENASGAMPPPTSASEEEKADAAKAKAQSAVERVRDLRMELVSAIDRLRTTTEEYELALAQATALSHRWKAYYSAGTGHASPDGDDDGKDRQWFEAMARLKVEAAAAARSDGTVIVVLVNKAFLELGMNFICSVQSTQVTQASGDIDAGESAVRVLGIAVDDASERFLRDRIGIATFRMPTRVHRPAQSNEEEEDTKERSSVSAFASTFQRYGTVELQELMHARGVVVEWLLELGYDVLVCDADQVWLRDPLHVLAQYRDPARHNNQILAINDARHPGETREVVGTGFMWIGASEENLEFWQGVMDEHAAMIETFEESDVQARVMLTERTIINKYYHLDESLATSDEELRWREIAQRNIQLLPSELFSNGRIYFERLNEDVAVSPVTVHANHLIGLVNKRDRLRQAQLWLLRASDGTCPLWPGVGDAREGASRGREGQSVSIQKGEGNTLLKIVVLARDVDHTKRCLEALRGSYYHQSSDDHDEISQGDAGDGGGFFFKGVPFIAIEIVIDALEQDEGDERLMLLAERFIWPHGEKRVRFHTAPESMWFSAWSPPTVTDGLEEMGLVIEDVALVSPFYFSWLDRACRLWFSTPGTPLYFPSTYGFSLTHQHSLLSVTSTPAGKTRTAFRRPRDSGEALPFGYQLPGTTAMLWRAEHWKSFQHWQHTRMSAVKRNGGSFERANIKALTQLRSDVEHDDGSEKVGFVSNDWLAEHSKDYAEDDRKKIWLALFARFAHDKGLYCSYVALPDNQVLCENALETKAGHNVVLAAHTPPLPSTAHVLQHPVFNLCGRQFLRRDTISRGGRVLC